MEKTFWKASAIIFFILFAILLTFIIWSVWYYGDEEAKTNECYYDICGDYPQAFYVNDVCSCYEYDLMGGLVIAKETYMK